MQATARWVARCFEQSSCQGCSPSSLDACVPARHGVDVRLDLVLCDEWVCAWPRPAPFGKQSVVVRIDKEGFVNMGSLFELPLACQSNKCACKWQKLLFSTPTLVATKGMLQATYLFQLAFEVQTLGSLAAQLSLAFAKRVEHLMAQQNAGKHTGEWVSFAFRESRVQVGTSDMDQQLFSYVGACVAESVHHNVIGIATDKASPCSGSFTNTLISFPNGKVAVCCPQVVD